MNFNINREPLKKRVLAIHKEKMETVGGFLTLGACYEFTAKLLGYKNWDTLSAVLKKEEENESN